MKLYIVLFFGGVTFFSMGCSDGKKNAQIVDIDQSIENQFDTSFYYLTSYVVNGKEIPRSDSNFYFFGDMRIVHFGEENVYEMDFCNDSVYISPGNYSAAMWTQFNDSLAVGYVAEDIRKRNQWEFHKNGRIQISMSNPSSKMSSDSQYIVNRGINYAVLDQLEIPIEKAKHINSIANSFNEGWFKAEQKSHPDFDPKSWK